MQSGLIQARVIPFPGFRRVASFESLPPPSPILISESDHNSKEKVIGMEIVDNEKQTEVAAVPSSSSSFPSDVVADDHNTAQSDKNSFAQASNDDHERRPATPDSARKTKRPRFGLDNCKQTKLNFVVKAKATTATTIATTSGTNIALEAYGSKSTASVVLVDTPLTRDETNNPNAADSTGSKKQRRKGKKDAEVADAQDSESQAEIKDTKGDRKWKRQIEGVQVPGPKDDDKTSSYNPRNKGKSSANNSFNNKAFTTSYASAKERLKEIAATTLEAIDHGSYECDGKTYELRETVDWMVEKTVYYEPEGELAAWAGGDSVQPSKNPSQGDAEPGDMEVETNPPPTVAPAKPEIALLEISTLEGAQYLYQTLPSLAKDDRRIGVLNFASAKKAGGGFINGARAQEESIARSSTLYASLMIDIAQAFYDLHVRDPAKGFYSHAMIYSPRVQIIRDDEGKWIPPLEVDIVTSPAVNAGDVRRKLNEERERAEKEGRKRKWWSWGNDDEEVGKWKGKGKGKDKGTWAGKRTGKRDEDPWKGAGKGRVLGESTDAGTDGATDKEGEAKGDVDMQEGADTASNSPSVPSTPAPITLSESEIEDLITSAMRERMARLLYLFQLQGVPNLVLGSFGTGVFRNHVDVVAKLWLGLLVEEGARFKGAFERIVFAVIGEETFRIFEAVFEEGGLQTSGGKRKPKPDYKKEREKKAKRDEEETRQHIESKKLEHSRGISPGEKDPPPAEDSSMAGQRMETQNKEITDSDEAKKAENPVLPEEPSEGSHTPVISTNTSSLKADVSMQDVEA